MLILTDHAGHSAENSLYGLARATVVHPLCTQLDVATRANIKNDAFFKGFKGSQLTVSGIDDGFQFSMDGNAYGRNLRTVSIYDYDVVWLRMPPPLSLSFLEFLTGAFPDQLFINDPGGIYETGSKAFLLKVSEYCPPMKRCRSMEDIIEFKNQFPIVLKPLRAYGGKGIVRIDGERVWMGNEKITFKAFMDQQSGSKLDYIGVKYLKNVSKGDKRIVVVNGEILGASLRLPAKESWLCNIAMGGKSLPSEVNSEERAIIEGIHPQLSALGIVMYGVDTLVDDEGCRVLSEINTTSIGGVTQIGNQRGASVIEKAVDLIWDYIIEKKSLKDAISN